MKLGNIVQLLAQTNQGFFKPILQKIICLVSNKRRLPAEVKYDNFFNESLAFSNLQIYTTKSMQVN